MDEGGTDVGQPFIVDLLNFLFLGVARLMDIVIEVSERKRIPLWVWESREESEQP